MREKRIGKLVISLTEKSNLFFNFLLWGWWFLQKDHYCMISQQAKEWLSGVTDSQKAGRLYKDMMRSFIVYGALPEDYMFFEFDRLSSEGRQEFITNGLRKHLLARVNSKKDDDLFLDKYKTYQLFKEFYKREIIVVKDECDYPSFCDFIGKYKEVVVKPITSSRGRGIYLLNTHDEHSKPLFYKLLEENKSGFVLEERIIQVEEMASFNESSVNTVRCPTCLTPDGIEIFHPIIRVGRDRSFVDNGGAGGILAAIDTKTGIVYTPGRDEKCHRYIIHPDSQKAFCGFVIPRWDELVKTVKQAALLIPTTRYVGWDMALTDKGWVIVEGNNYGQFAVIQIPDKAGLRREFEKIMHI